MILKGCKSFGFRQPHQWRPLMGVYSECAKCGAVIEGNTPPHQPAPGAISEQALGNTQLSAEAILAAAAPAAEEPKKPNPPGPDGRPMSDEDMMLYAHTLGDEG